MREVATTGDLTRKIAAGHRDRWQDEDARLLATTFNTLTDSIARFQREMSQKERLTSLGRLSTVIAHEVRNPLMIIKASLHTLRQPDVPAESMREAIADIDEEVARLNRIVNEVLDFARPIRFELSTVDVNALCRVSAAAAQASGPGAPIVLRLDGVPRVDEHVDQRDAEALRVDEDLAQSRIELELDPRTRRAGFARGGRLAAERVQISGDQLERNRSGEIEHLVHHPVQTRYFAVDVGGRLAKR